MFNGGQELDSAWAGYDFPTTSFTIEAVYSPATVTGGKDFISKYNLSMGYEIALVNTHCYMFLQNDSNYRINSGTLAIGSKQDIAFTVVAGSLPNAYTNGSLTNGASGGSGSGVSITIKDSLGNTIASGLTTLARERLAIGQQISWGGFSVAPTVAVFQVGG